MIKVNLGLLMLYHFNPMNERKKIKMKFCEPMVWREYKDRLTDCHFYMTKISRFSKTRSQIKCPNCPSAINRLPNSLHHPTPQLPCLVNFDSEAEKSTDPSTGNVSESRNYS